MKKITAFLINVIVISGMLYTSAGFSADELPTADSSYFSYDEQGIYAEIDMLMTAYAESGAFEVMNTEHTYEIYGPYKQGRIDMDKLFETEDMTGFEDVLESELYAKYFVYCENSDGESMWLDFQFAVSDGVPGFYGGGEVYAPLAESLLDFQSNFTDNDFILIDNATEYLFITDSDSREIGFLSTEGADSSGYDSADLIEYYKEQYEDVYGSMNAEGSGGIGMKTVTFDGFVNGESESDAPGDTSDNGAEQEETDDPVTQQEATDDGSAPEGTGSPAAPDTPNMLIIGLSAVVIFVIIACVAIVRKRSTK